MVSSLLAKYFELDSKIPYIEDYMHFSVQKIAKAEVQEAERKVLSMLNWNLAICTPTYLVNLLSVVESAPLHSPTNIDANIFKKALLIAEEMMKENVMIENTCSKIAAACVLASRKCESAAPLWPKHMVEITKYGEKQIADLANKILQIYNNNTLPMPINICEIKSQRTMKACEKENACNAKHEIPVSSNTSFSMTQHKVVLQEKANSEFYFPCIKVGLGIKKESLPIKKTKLLCKSSIIKELPSQESKHSSYAQRNIHTSMRIFPTKHTFHTENDNMRF